MAKRATKVGLCNSAHPRSYIIGPDGSAARGKSKTDSAPLQVVPQIWKKNLRKILPVLAALGMWALRGWDRSRYARGADGRGDREEPRRRAGSPSWMRKAVHQACPLSRRTRSLFSFLPLSSAFYFICLLVFSYFSFYLSGIECKWNGRLFIYCWEYLLGITKQQSDELRSALTGLLGISQLLGTTWTVLRQCIKVHYNAYGKLHAQIPKKWKTSQKFIKMVSKFRVCAGERVYAVSLVYMMNSCQAMLALIR